MVVSLSWWKGNNKDSNDKSARHRHCFSQEVQLLHPFQATSHILQLLLTNSILLHVHMTLFQQPDCLLHMRLEVELRKANAKEYRAGVTGRISGGDN